MFQEEEILTTYNLKKKLVRNHNTHAIQLDLSIKAYLYRIKNTMISIIYYISPHYIYKHIHIQRRDDSS